MKKLLLIFALIPMMLFGQNNSDNHVLTVTGDSWLFAEPDWIELKMTIKQTENLKKSSEIVNMENSVLKFMLSLGLDSSSFSIDQFDASSKLSYSSSAKYKMSKTYKLVINNIKLIDTVMNKCFEEGVDNIYINQIGNSKLDSLQNLALIGALKAAQKKAEIITKTMNINLGKVIDIDEKDQWINLENYEYNKRGFSFNKFDERISSPLSLQKIGLKSEVIVKYQIQ